MALQTIPGDGLWLPGPYVAGASFGSLVIDATGEKNAFCGRVWNKDGTTKSITKVGFRFGSVTKAGGSALTVSLQDVSLTAGPVMQPDETQDQTVAIANADAGFTSNAWYQTNALSANRSVTFGELLAVVIEYDGGGRLGADTVAITGITNVAGTERLHQCVFATKTGGTWASAHQPNVILEFTDGTFGTLRGALPASAYATLTYKQDTATEDEYALSFRVPFACKVDGAFALMSAAAATSNFDVVLYDGTTAMTGGTVSVDANSMQSGAGVLEVPFTEPITLAINTTYRLAIKPTQTTSNVSIYYRDVANANHLQAFPGGVNWVLDSRVDLGAWIGAVSTRQPMMGIHISALDDGAGAAGGMLVHPGMGGGARG